jgi:hypothetical protein
MRVIVNTVTTSTHILEALSDRIELLDRTVTGKAAL